MQRGTYTVRPGLTIEVEAETQVQLMEELSSAAEVFGETCCGLCGETAIFPIFRHVGKYTYAEWGCPCGARLSLGNTMEGGRLFPIRALTPEGKPDREKGTRGEHNGWTKYRGPAGDAGPTTPVPHKAPAPATTVAPSKGTVTSVVESPGYKPPTRAEAGAPISAEQWSAIQVALKSRFISPRAFLTRYGYAEPRDINAQHYDELIEAARNPDDELRRVQKTMPIQQMTGSGGGRRS